MIDVDFAYGSRYSGDMNTTPETAKAHFRELRQANEVTAKEAELALKRWATTGHAWLVRGGTTYKWTDESFGCDCGKGILCPAVSQRPASNRRR